jgi:hypothetical protein
MQLLMPFCEKVVHTTLTRQAISAFHVSAAVVLLLL